MQIEIPDHFIEEMLDILNGEIIKHKDVIMHLRQKNEEGDYDAFIEANHDYIKEIEFITAQLKTHEQNT
jgi:hypothetical protein